MDALERCRRTLDFQPTDRAPRYLPALSCHVASELLGRPTCCGTGSLHWAEVRALALGPAAHADFVARLDQDIVAVHRHLGIDVFREPWRMTARPTRMIDEHTFLFGDPDGEHVVWQYDPESADFGVIQRRVDPARSPEDRLRAAVEQAEAMECDLPARTAQALRPQMDCWRRVGAEFFHVSGGGGISAGIDEDAMLMLAAEPALVARRCMAQAKAGVELARQIIAAGMPGVMLGGGDLAGADGVIYGPHAFRRVVFPAYQHLIANCNAMNVHYVFRSDGNLWQITDMLFTDARCPGYGETDRDCTMTVAALRQRYPKLVIWGNVASSLLHHATPQQVRAESRRVLDESAGRGYFHGCSNAIVKGTPPANVEALFDASP